LANLNRKREFALQSDAWSGRITDPAVRQYLHEKIMERNWSVSRLTEYQKCPYRFFLRYVLDIEEFPAPEIEPDQRLQGNIAHRCLELFFRRRHDSGAPGLAAEEPGRRSHVIEELHRTAETVFAEYGGREYLGRPELWPVCRDRILARLDRLVNYEFDCGEPDLKPAWFEFVFSDAPGADEPAFRLDLPGGHSIRLTGRIDRIDRSEDGRVLVLDYKDSDHSPKLEDDLQVPVYLMVIRARLARTGEKVSRLEGGYCRLKHKTLKNMIEYKPMTPETLDARAAQIGELVARIGEGHFEPRLHGCPEYCQMRKLCRRPGG
jgi:ATP-dependent helicase/DNAse subunit B